MKSPIYIFPLFLFLALQFSLSADNIQDPSVVCGRVFDSHDSEPVPFVTVMVEGTTIGAVTDEYGFYRLANIPPGQVRLVVQGMGHETAYRNIDIQPGESIVVDFTVKRGIIELGTVLITASPTASGFRYQSDLSFYGENLQRRSEASFGEMLDGEPGLAMRSNGSAPSRPVIRGMDGDRILVLEHGERMGDVSESGSGHSLTMDPLSASRVEVVKGPTSIMYGSSALGGVINLMTVDIPEEWDLGSSGVLSAHGATVNNMGAGFARFTHGNSTWAASGRIAYRGAGDIRTPEGLMPGTYINNFDGALGLGLNKNNLKGGVSLSANDQVYGLPEFLDDPNESVEVRQRRYGMQGRFSYDREGFFDTAQLRFQATHLDQKEIEIEIEDGLIDEDIELSHYKHSFSSTLTLQHRPVWIFDRGAFGINLHGHNLDIGGDEAYTPGERRGNAGLFTYQEIPLSDRWRLQAGLRIDALYTSALANEIFPDADASTSSVNLTGSVGLNYRPASNVEIGGQLARAHRNPMVEELFADGPHLCSGVYELGNKELRDEVGHGLDLFMRWTTSRVAFEIAGFYNQYDNYIIFEPTGEIDQGSMLPVFHYLGDAARFYGGELASAINISRSLRLDISVDYVNARRTGGEREYLPFIPPLRLRTELEYCFEQAWISANMRSVAKQGRVAPEEDLTGGYTLFGMAAGYRIDYSGRHVIMLRADNIADRKYRDHLSRIEDRQFPMPGRNLSLAYRFYF